MKKSFLPLAIFLLILMLNQACTSEPIQNLSTVNDTVTTLQFENTFNNMFVFPVGSNLKIKGSSLYFKLPKGYELVARLKDIAGNITIKRIAEGSVTCTCTEGKGCNPYIINDQSGCSTSGTCTKCTMTIKSNETNKNINLELLDAQIVNFNQEYQLLLYKNDYQKLVPPKKFIFEDEKVKSYLNDFLSRFNNEQDGNNQKSLKLNQKTTQYIFVPVNFLGLQILTALNKDKCSMTNSLKIMVDYGCKCSSGESGCTYGSSWTPKGRIYYCDAEECTSCTLYEK